MRVAALLAAGTLGHLTMQAQSASDVFFYNANNQFSGIGYVATSHASLNSTAYTFDTVKDFSSIGSWTHVIGLGPNGGVLLYNSATGVAQQSNFTENSPGLYVTYPTLAFSAGWTSIVYHKGFVFFYNAKSGVAAVGSFDGVGNFTQYNTWYSFSTGWTSIVSTPSGMLFYNANDGSGAVGDWNVTSGPGFGVILAVDFVQTASYAPGSFSYGWTNIVSTINGLLFYNASSGLVAMADLWPNGSMTTRTSTVATIRPNWSAIVSDGVNLLFYDTATGDGAIGGISANPLANPGGLVIRKNMPGAFSKGWTDLAPAAIEPRVN